MSKSVVIKKEAKNSLFKNCTFHGEVENSGKNTFFDKSIFFGFKKIEDVVERHPFVCGVLTGVIATVVGESIFFFVQKFLEKHFLNL